MAAERKVSVFLELELAQANRNSTEFAVRLKVAKTELEDLGDKADDTSRDLDQLAANADLAATKVDEVGDQARGTAVDLTILDARIRTVRASMNELTAQFAQGLDPDVGKQMDTERAELARLERIRKQLTPKLDPTNFMGIDFSGMVAESRGVLIASAVGLGVAMAPVLAGIISSAVVGTIGAGGVVGGAFLAARDWRVKQAWTDVGSELMRQLDGAGEVFVEPIIRAGGTFKQAFYEADIIGLLEEAAQLVDPLTEAFAGLGRELGPGLKAAVVGADPTIRMWAKELPQLGTSVSRMLFAMKSVGPEAAIAFGDFFDVLEQGVEDTGDLLAGLTEVYSMTRSINQTAKELTGYDLFGDIIPTTGIIGIIGRLLEGKTAPSISAVDRALDGVNAGFAALDVQLVQTTPHLDWFGQALEDVRNAANDWVDAEVNVEESLDNLSESFAEYGRTLDVDTEAGRANVRAMRDYADQARDAYNAKLEETKSLEEAQKTWDEYRQKLYDVMIQAGYTKDMANELITKFLGIPPVIIPVTTPGLDRALEDARELRRMLYDSIPADPGGLAAIQAAERASHSGRAAGGPVLAGRVYRVNEQQAEGFWRAPYSGMVMPLSGAPARGWDGASGGGIDYGRLAEAMSRVQLAGVAIMDGRAVGELVGAQQTSSAYQRPRL